MTQHNTAIDTLRGIGILGMIVVSYSNLQTPLWSSTIQSAPHVGSRATDLILPLFLFAIGASMAYSFSQYEKTLSLFRKIFIRSGAFILIGVGLTLFHLYTDTREGSWESYVHRFADYAQYAQEYHPLIRIGLCILLGGTIVALLRNYALLLLSILPLAILHIYSLLWLIDAQLVDFSGIKELALSHIQHHDTIRHHDFGHDLLYLEGLSILPATIPLIFGYVTAHTIIETRNINKLAQFTCVTFLIFFLIMHYLDYCAPILSHLWTSSYALHASLIIIPLLFFISTAEHFGLKSILYPLRALGYNSLLIYLGVELLTKLMNQVLLWTDLSAELSIYSYYYHEVCYFYARQNEIVANIYYTLTLIAVILIPSLILYWLKKRMKI